MSEEDEKMINDIDDCIKNLPIFYETIQVNGEKRTTQQFVDSVRNWLKSIKPNHWKPSKEQMEELEYVTRGNSYPHLTSLYQDLKNFKS